ncbi:hypothetical protein E3Q23_00655 [Wallemia mellicola]|uniref:peptidylprolyl isomerase n=1 Tax=Wallemia mellicola TaxID=1708541 RepID=A0A4T0TX00_9BASI|nr:hypothetical protein E3Q23_00655 [Wallemia mellicola]TIB93840.1 hypothetical protein E3Q19_00748 [Wallemia mellicola]TIC04770.1 hypothetical protein E3Q17_00239 [Wallemia mellicola]TIC30622.1 hypothetical protein E3Q11_00875 [Wallemia mellicola]TIC69888.1 hypothetical protein E3Q02_00805 [Wallemia mellicola]
MVKISALVLGVIGAVAATTKTPPSSLQIGIKEKADPCQSGYLFDDGSQFDSSRNPGRQPFTFKLGAGQVISGWEKGVLGMCVGERRKVTIPPSLGYGSRAIGPIPAESTLVFDIELLDGASGPGKAVHNEL